MINRKFANAIKKIPGDHSLEDSRRKKYLYMNSVIPDIFLIWVIKIKFANIARQINR